MIQSINKYRNELKKIIDFGGSPNETTIRHCFISLVNDFAEDKNQKIDQYKLKKIEDPTVAEKFITYTYSQYKNEIITFIKKIITISLETNKILVSMKNEGKIQ
jgi:hypothetical protein